MTDFAGRLAPYLQAQKGSDLTITEHRRIATGNSRANHFVATSDGARYVVRIEQGGVFGTSSADEFRFMQAARALGCPVAPVRWLEATGEVMGQPFFVMDFVDGVPGGRDDRSMSDTLAEDFIGKLDALHRYEWASELDGADAAGNALSGVGFTHAQIDHWLNVYRSSADVAIPLLEEGAAWLHHHAPTPARIGIVHADPGPGNFVHDGNRVVAFTDWEFTHLGDPMEDWTYLISMRGSRTMDADAWRELFLRYVGIEVTEDDQRYWSAFNFFKGACANLTCRDVFVTTNRAPNMALIGTALHQHFLRQLAELVGNDR